MKRLLVLGSDYFTKAIIQEAKKRGCYVIVADYNEETPTKKMADETWLVSTADTEEIQKRCIARNIEAIITGASDFNTEMSRILCKKLGLPLFCASDLAWETSRNKEQFKKICIEVGAPIPKGYKVTDTLTDAELDNIAYPVVVKPVDKCANQGMSYCYNKEELIAGYRYARSVSDNESIIVEQMLKGTEHHVCYCVAEGEISLISFAESYHCEGQLSNMYSYESNTSKYLQQYIDNVNDSVIQVFKKIGCTDGIVWVDTMRDKDDGKFYILEMGYRIPAALCSSPLYERVMGFNVIKWMVDCALGVKHAKYNMPLELKQPYSSLLGQEHMFIKKDSIISKIDGLEEISNLENVSFDIPKQINSKVNAYSCIALVSIYGRNCDEVLETLRKVNDVFRIYDEYGKNIVIYYDSYEIVKKDVEEGKIEFLQSK